MNEKPIRKEIKSSIPQPIEELKPISRIKAISLLMSISKIDISFFNMLMVKYTYWFWRATLKRALMQCYFLGVIDKSRVEFILEAHRITVGSPSKIRKVVSTVDEYNSILDYDGE